MPEVGIAARLAHTADREPGKSAGMQAASGAPWDEAARITALHSYAVLDTPPERDFDEVVQLAAQLCDAPIAVVTLVAAERQFFKAEIVSVKALPSW